jgi:ABC 3 transport family
VRTAFLVGTIVAITSGVVGVLTVIRGQSFAGHSLADVATTGGAGAFLAGLDQFTVWIAIIASYQTNWPLGSYVGVTAAGFFLARSGWTAVRRRWSAHQPTPALAPAL